MKINYIMTVVSANDGSDKNLPPSIAGERGGENISKQEEELVKRYVEMLGDTPLRLEVDFAVPNSTKLFLQLVSIG